MIERAIAAKALSLATQFPILSITGPRQSGKTTLVKTLFSSYSYVSLEDPDMRSFATDDPRAFLDRFGRQTIIDEVQRIPQLFSYLQGLVDETGEPGQFIVTGSQNFLLMEATDQSLSGRVAILNLLPFSARELMDANRFPATLNEWLYTGAYPSSSIGETLQNERLTCLSSVAPRYLGPSRLQAQQRITPSFLSILTALQKSWVLHQSGGWWCMEAMSRLRPHMA